MEKGLFTLQSAEMLARCAFWIAVGIAGWDVEAIEQPQAVLQIRRGIRLPIPLWQSSPEPREGVPPGLLPQGQVQPFEGLLHRLVRREAGPFMAAGLLRLIGLIQITQGLLQPVGRSIRHGSCALLQAIYAARPAAPCRPSRVAPGEAPVAQG